MEGSDAGNPKQSGSMNSWLVTPNSLLEIVVAVKDVPDHGLKARNVGVTLVHRGAARETSVRQRCIPFSFS